MARIMVTVTGTYGGLALRRGEVIEASAALATAIGANGRTLPATGLTPSHDSLGEAVGVSNSSP